MRHARVYCAAFLLIRDNCEKNFLTLHRLSPAYLHKVAFFINVQKNFS
jgi:hypothetical protein